MRWADIGEDVCSVSRALSVVGDRWTLLIIRSAFLGARRFSEFQKDIGLTRHRLSDRLNKLVEDQVFEKVQYQSNPVRYEYRLTDRGKELYPVIMTLVKWGDKWMAGDGGKPMEYEHKSCGNNIMPVLTCPECHEEIDPHDMKAMPGPALQALMNG
ncbi:helix-turn-helix transcriptional regulator [Pseudomaricurvus alkylphenolicus]|uniref:winged helix-turn-helix transcriptional regulator n=1 Tax=Pseudomaricurvus alkylphenolicus TaxID=1306991 RepID=UPI0014202483|nr:helix-turn-helix transcriptional regulator [Pseudomaricurvus alkylphenolicus]